MRGEVLVAILNNILDFNIARERGWYRIPVDVAGKRLKDRWPPKWLAFYQTKVFGQEGHSIHYFAPVLDIREVSRAQLFPEEPPHAKSFRRYHQAFIGPLQQLPKPILSRRFRRIVFIPTTWHKFTNAVEINDLWDESLLEDRLWAQFKRLKINAECQEMITVKDRYYFLDFAIYCALGRIDVETDGDVWHANPERAPQDNLRDNDIKTVGWKVLRFNGRQIREQMGDYCVPTITENIDRLGGLNGERIVPRRVDPGVDDVHQPSLFDDL